MGQVSRAHFEDKLRPLSKPPFVGLTGSLASGKSTALKTFEERGWAVASADAMVHAIYEREGEALEELRQKTLKNPRFLKQLEKKLHPLVREEVLSLRQETKQPLIVEIPLLFEAKFESFFDLSIYVFADKRSRKKRALERGMTAKLFDYLEDKQWSTEKKSRKADLILWNEKKTALQKQVRALHDLILK